MRRRATRPQGDRTRNPLTEGKAASQDVAQFPIFPKDLELSTTDQPGAEAFTGMSSEFQTPSGTPQSPHTHDPFTSALSRALSSTGTIVTPHTGQIGGRSSTSEYGVAVSIRR